MESPRPWLRYVDGSDLDNSTIPFDGMTVESPSGEKLGAVDGAIVDVSSGRPYYVVVDAGGWFTSKFFLLPIGHVEMSSAQDRMVADVGKDRVERYPGFDRGAFETLSDAEMDRMAGQIADACCPSIAASSSTAAFAWTTRSHYTSPSWWRSDYYRASSTSSPIAGERATSAWSGSAAAAREDAETREREHVVAHGGEETHIGDTSDDENERRRDAERTGAKRARP